MKSGGDLESDEAAKTYYKNIMTIAIIIGAVLLPLGGKIADITPAYLFVPITFLLKSSIAAQFSLVDNPVTVYA